VGVRVAAHVEALRVVELAGVAVGGAVEQHDLVALVEVLPDSVDVCVAVRRMNVTGDATRTISSDGARGDTLEVVLPDPAAGPGFCDSRFIPWLMPVRVVSLPATARRMKNGAISCGVSMSLPEVVVDELRGEVVGGSARRSSASSFMRLVSCMPTRRSAVITSRPPRKSGSPPPRITLVASSTVWNSLRGMPIMSQITSSGNGCDMTSTRSTSPCSQKPSITSVQIVSTESSTPCSWRGRERAGHDAALAGVAGSSMLMNDPKNSSASAACRGSTRALARAEVLGAAADLDDLVVPRARRRSARATRHLVLELDGVERSLLAHLREAGHALGERQRPEAWLDSGDSVSSLMTTLASASGQPIHHRPDG
jgi:hypothetical protein